MNSIKPSIHMSKHRANRLSIGLFTAAALLLIVGLFIAVRQYHANIEAAKQAAQNPAAPLTIKPSAHTYAAYTVAPDAPRYLIIPTIGVNAMVENIGLTKSGAIGTPDNVYESAWYRASSKPGTAGATVIDGHVSSWTTSGVFYNLHKLAPGAKIEIERGDGTIVTYQVVGMKTYSYNNVDMSSLLSPINAKKSGLNLITCSGSVIKGTNEFDKRIVVFSEQI
jgi:sortase (surface protein transpeptidase)